MPEQKEGKEEFISMIEQDRIDCAIKINLNLSFPEEFIQSPEVQRVAIKVFIENLNKNRADRAMKIKENFSLPEEFVQQSTKEAFIKHLKEGWINRAMIIKEKFSLPREFIQSPEVQHEAREIFDKYLKADRTDLASNTKEAFSLIISPQELIDQDSSIKVLLLKIKEISPEFYDQALKSFDIIISLFPLAKDSEQTITTIRNNPFLIDAVSKNSRYGSQLLVKYSEFDETSKKNIEFMFNAEKEILKENPNIDLESMDYRKAIQEKLKTHENNPEILKQIESKGIDIDQWLNYSEIKNFSLNSGENNLAFSETVATPINRIKETISNYTYQVREVLEEYKKELRFYKIKAGNVSETSELIKKMENELSKAESEGDKTKIEGIKKGIASYQEKMKKGKEIPLWDKVIGDISSFDRLKNDVFLSHENVIKAEEKIKEYNQDKSHAVMDIMEEKRTLTEAKEDLREKFNLLEKRIEDFRNNFVSIIAPALGEDKIGKGRAESISQEIQEGLSEQFNHYDSDRTTLANLFSEHSDKEKEKLDNRPMNISIGARNPNALYLGNQVDCCIRINSEHMGKESTIADYNTDLGIQIINIWDEAKNEPITAAWCWIGEDKDENAALVVDNIESNTLYSTNYSEQLTDELFTYLKKYAKAIGIKKIAQGKANNDLPVASRLAKMNSDDVKYQKVGGYNRENGYYLEAKNKSVKVIWEEKARKQEKKERKETKKVEFKNRKFEPLIAEYLPEILKLEEKIYKDDDLNQGKSLKEDIKKGKGFDYSVVLTGEKKEGEKEIIGYIIGVESETKTETDKGKPSIYLEDITIAPEAQGQGLGWEIMRKMIEKIKEKAISEKKIILLDMHLRDSSQGLMEKHREDLKRLGLKLVKESLFPDYYSDGDDSLYQVYEVKG